MSSGIKLMVCGCRDFGGAEVVFEALDRWAFSVHAYPPDGKALVLVGDAAGVDAIALDWAKARGHDWERFEADWTLGRKAGPIRNGKIVARGPHYCVAFWDGRSPGTKDAISQAVRAWAVVTIHPIGALALKRD